MKKLQLLIRYYFCLFCLWLARKTPLRFNFALMFGQLLFPESANYPEMYDRYSGTDRSGPVSRTNSGKKKKPKPILDVDALLKDPEFAAMAKQHPEMLDIIKLNPPIGKTFGNTKSKPQECVTVKPEETPCENPLARKDD